MLSTALLILLIPAGAAEATGTQQIHFDLDSAVIIGALQFDVAFPASSGTFNASSCTLSQAISSRVNIHSAQLRDGSDNLSVSMVSLGGFTGPARLMTCDFELSAAPLVTGDLAISVFEAADLSAAIYDPAPALRVALGAVSDDEPPTPVTTTLAPPVLPSSTVTTTLAPNTTSTTSTTSTTETTTTLPPAPPADTGVVELVIELLGTVRLGALDFTVDYRTAGGTFIGPCRPFARESAPEDRLLFTSSDNGAGMLQIGTLGQAGVPPGPVARCLFAVDPGARVSATDFLIARIEAVDRNGAPKIVLMRSVVNAGIEMERVPVTFHTTGTSTPGAIAMSIDYANAPGRFVDPCTAAFTGDQKVFLQSHDPAGYTISIHAATVDAGLSAPADVARCIFELPAGAPLQPEDFAVTVTEATDLNTGAAYLAPPAIGVRIGSRGCVSDADCDDGNICTTNRCDHANGDPATGCVTALNSAPCNDGVFCNGADRCSAGTCSRHEGDPCPGINGDRDCTQSCDESADDCTAADPDGSPCDDADACTLEEICNQGVCGGGTTRQCNDNESCTTDSCDSSAADANSITGCVHRPNSDSCDDGNACTTGDTCSGGTCTATAQLDCDDGNPCTDDTCRPASGCVYADNIAPCDDGNPCTNAERCTEGSCRALGTESCPEGTTCDETTAGNCVACVNVLQTDSTVTCSLNRKCSVPIRLETNGITDVTGLVATQSSAEIGFSCLHNECVLGPAVDTAGNPDASCDTVGETCSFYVFDFQGSGLADGTVAELPIVCTEEGRGLLCLHDVSLSTDDSGDVPTCTNQSELGCQEFVCDRCMSGDCTGDKALRVNDAICSMNCAIPSLRAEAETGGADCTCAADCNCSGRAEIADAICVLERMVLSGGRSGLDRCDSSSATALVAMGATGATGAKSPALSVQVKAGQPKPAERGKRQHVLLSLSSEADLLDVAALMVRLSSDGGKVKRVRLTRRLRSRGFVIRTTHSAGRTEVGVLPPMRHPVPPMGKGKALKIIVTGKAAGVVIHYAELGSTGGEPVETR